MFNQKSETMKTLKVILTAVLFLCITNADAIVWKNAYKYYKKNEARKHELKVISLDSLLNNYEKLAETDTIPGQTYIYARGYVFPEISTLKILTVGKLTKHIYGYGEIKVKGVKYYYSIHQSSRTDNSAVIFIDKNKLSWENWGNRLEQINEFFTYIFNRNNHPYGICRYPEA
jgi:hypothetical protein